jgi:hypothetical protein
VFGVTDREEIVLGGSDAVEAELEIGAGVGELGLDDADGFEIFHVSRSELLVGGHVFLGKVESLGEEAVTHGVEGGTFLAFGSLGTGGVPGIGTVGANAGIAGVHVWLLDEKR